MKQPHFQHLILKAVRLLELLLAAAIVLIIITARSIFWALPSSPC